MNEDGSSGQTVEDITGLAECRSDRCRKLTDTTDSIRGDLDYLM